MRARITITPLLVTILTFVSGCASISRVPDSQVVTEKQVSEKSYVLGKPADAFVGNVVIRVKDYVSTEVALNKVEVTSDFVFDGPLWTRQFRRGEGFRLAGIVEYEGSKFNVARIDEQRGVLFDDAGVVFEKMIANVDGVGMGPPVFVVYSYTVQPPGPHMRRVVEQRTAGRQAGQNYEIVFTGVTPDTIRMSYREYTADDLARPAFSQELTYPRTSTEIRFRNLVISIIEATPDHLRYAVLSD